MKSTRSLLAAATISLLVVALTVVAILLGLFRGVEPPPDGGGAEATNEAERPGEPEELDDAGRVGADEMPESPVPPQVVETKQPVTRITGRVWLEAAGNPAAAAHVAAVVDGEREQALAVATDEDGRYELVGLEPEKYQVWAWTDTWTTPMGEGRQAVELEAGAKIDGVDRTLVHGVVVRGQVVEEGSRTPLEGAQVRSGFQTATTDAEGRFRLEGLNGGPLHVIAKAEFHATTWVEADVAVGEDAFFVIELAPGGIIEGIVTDADGAPAAGVGVTTFANSFMTSEESGDDGSFQLDGVPLNVRSITISASRQGRFPTSARVAGFPEGENRVRVDLRLSRGFVLAGRVVDEDSAPVEGATFYVDWSSWKILATSDAEGRFEIDGASDKMSTLTARKSGYAPSSIGLRNLDAEERETIELVLEPGHILAGTVLDGEQNPLERAWVYVGYRENHAGPYPSTWTDAAGRFEFEDLPAAIEEIGSTRQGYTDHRGIVVDVDREDVEIVLEETGQIQGFVVDAKSGEPVSPFVVKVSFDWQRRGGKRHQGGMSASLSRRGLRFGLEDGSFALRSEVQPAVSYELIVEADGYAEATLSEVEAWPLSEERDPIRVELERGRVLAGQVVDASSRTPLEGVHVTHLSKAPRSPGDLWRTHDQGSGRAVRKAVTDGEGAFEIIGLTREPGVLLLDRVGFARTALTGIGASDDARVFELEAEAVIEGAITGADGEPRKEIRVTARRDEERFPATSTDAEGRYRLGGLPAGEIVVETSASGRPAMTRVVTLSAGEVTTVDFVEATGSIAGRISQGTEPVVNAQISMTGVGRQVHAWTTTDQQGDYRIDGVEAGEYRVGVTQRNRRNTYRQGPERTVEVGAGETRCDLAYASNRIAGRLVDRVSGGPVPGAVVELHRRGRADSFGGSFYSIRHDWQWVTRCQMNAGENEFEFDALAAGEYFLTASSGEEADKRTLGWFGPLNLLEGSSIEELSIAVGGGARLTLSVRDDDGPVENASGVLRLAGLPLAVAKRSDASGRVVIDGVPAGSYRLEIESGDHRRFTEDLEIGAAAVERAVTLRRAAHIVVELRGERFAAEPHNLVATILSGDDPGWIWRSAKGDLPVMPASYRLEPGQQPEVRLKIRPGSYRLRFDVTRPNKQLGARPDYSRELDAKVAEREVFRVAIP